MNQTIGALKDVLFNLHRDDLTELTIEELGSLEADLLAWANIALVARMEKRAAIRDEASE